MIRQAFRDTGYGEGQNIRTEWRYAEGRTERLATLATELVSPKPEAIVTFGGPVIRAVRLATSNIPLIAMADDLVREGHIVSLARPGGNVTGVSIFGPELDVKRLELKRDYPRLPATYQWDQSARDGGLIGYGPTLMGLYRTAFVQLGKVLNGADPATLPAAQPTEFKIVVNMKTARALRFAIPSSVLARADEIIE